MTIPNSYRIVTRVKKACNGDWHFAISTILAIITSSSSLLLFIWVLHKAELDELRAMLKWTVWPSENPGESDKWKESREEIAMQGCFIVGHLIRAGDWFLI